ncbi:MAG TPA: VOC family protein [Candidatus Limnocylindrales bacterium]|nr:VOC family protein [Candidatus Limnocylindrales bacterium]
MSTRTAQPTNTTSSADSPSALLFTRVLHSFSVDEIAKAEQFYRTVLGLPARAEFERLWIGLDGSTVMVYPKPDHIPASYTVLNFVVEDIVAAVEALAARGVRFLRYDEFGSDGRGIVRSDGRALAWFTDPAGNIHSVAELQGPIPDPREG